jgi:hypothetical protein
MSAGKNPTTLPPLKVEHDSKIASRNAAWRDDGGHVVHPNGGVWIHSRWSQFQEVKNSRSARRAGPLTLSIVTVG